MEEKIRCPECQGDQGPDKNFVCPICQNNLFISPELAHMLGSLDTRLQKGLLVRVRYFSFLLFKTEDNILFRRGPDQSAELRLHQLGNPSTQTIYMLTGYDWLSEGSWGKDPHEDQYRLSVERRVQTWKVTPYLSGLSQTYYALPTHMELVLSQQHPSQKKYMGVFPVIFNSSVPEDVLILSKRKKGS